MMRRTETPETPRPDRFGSQAAPGSVSQAAPSTAVQPSEPAPRASDQNPGEAAAGQELFNGTCAHCHGPDAATVERRINLRLLKRRYGDKMDETFMFTVMNGRPEKGMPGWSEAFSNDHFTKMLSFLHLVQTH